MYMHTMGYIVGKVLFTKFMDVINLGTRLCYSLRAVFFFLAFFLVSFFHNSNVFKFFSLLLAQKHSPHNRTLQKSIIDPTIFANICVDMALPALHLLLSARRALFFTASVSFASHGLSALLSFSFFYRTISARHKSSMKLPPMLLYL